MCCLKMFSLTKHSRRQPAAWLYTLRKHINISRMKKNLIFFCLSLFLIISCSKNDDTPSNDCSSSPKSFSADVNPIIQSSCATNNGCHGTGSINGPGPLLTYTQVFNARFAIKSAVANGSMPKNGSLTSAQKSAIICWVDNGAANN